MSLFSREPQTHKWVLRYQRQDGQYREINLRAVSKEAAIEIADRRLHEQYGDGLFERETREQEFAGDARTLAEAQLLRDRPDLHQDNYMLVSAEKC